MNPIYRRIHAAGRLITCGMVIFCAEIHADIVTIDNLTNAIQPFYDAAAIHDWAVVNDYLADEVRPAGKFIFTNVWLTTFRLGAKWKLGKSILMTLSPQSGEAAKKCLLCVSTLKTPDTADKSTMYPACTRLDVWLIDARGKAVVIPEEFLPNSGIVLGAISAKPISSTVFNSIDEVLADSKLGDSLVSELDRQRNEAMAGEMKKAATLARKAQGK